MKWTALAYSFPAKSNSTQRVNFWRRLRRLGAVAPVAGIYLLPAHPACVEAFDWLVQEICQTKGEAFTCIVEQFRGMSEQQLVELFNAARDKEYEEIAAQLGMVEAALGTASSQERVSFKETANKLRRHFGEIVRIDFFHAPMRTRVAEQLAELEQLLSPEKQSVSTIPLSTVSDYVGKKWVTRPRPYVDRLACTWLIRRFIDPNASIRFGVTPEADEIAFDMSEGQFTHSGNLCTFETMLLAFRFDEPELRKIAEIVHEIDLHDGKFVNQEIGGIDAVLTGWLLADVPDHDLKERGIALFEGLYLSYQFSGAKGDEPVDQGGTN